MSSKAFILFVSASFSFLSAFSEADLGAGNKINKLLTIAEKYIYQNPGKAFISSKEAYERASLANDSVHMAEADYYVGIYHVYAGKVNEGEEYLNSALNLFRALNDHQGLVDCMLELGEIYYNRGQFEQSLNYFFKANKLAKEKSYKHGEAAAMNYIGKYHHSKGNFERSHNYYIEALHIAQNVRDIEQMIYIKNNLGKHYETLALYEQALAQYMEVFELLSQTGNKVLIGTTYNHLGNIYEKLGDKEQALQYHMVALQHRKDIKYLEGVAKSEKNIGEIFEQKGALDTALVYYKNSMQRCQKIGYRKGMIKSLYLSGNIYRKKGMLNKAEEHYLMAVDLSKDIGYEKGMLYTYLYLAKLYMLKKNYNQAEDYIGKGIQLSKGDQLTGLLVDFYYLKHELYTSKNEYEAALKHYRLYAQTREKLLDEEKNRNIEELRVTFESERKDQQNKILRQENELKNLAIQRKNALIAAVVAVLIMLTIFTFMIYYRFKSKEKANRELEFLNKKITEKNSQLARLNKELDKANNEKDRFFSIIGHELRNPLWWFKNLSETLTKKFQELEKEKLQKALLSLNDSAKTAFHLIDNLLQWSRNQLGRLNYQPRAVEINELIHRNKELFRQELDHKSIGLHSNITENDLKVMVDAELIDTVLRNLILNAIKYTPDHGTISIESTLRGEFVEVCIADSGIGISKENQRKLFNPKVEYTTLGLYQEKGSGLGLLLCKDFIEMNGGKIWLESDEGKGTAFYITLPLAMQEVLV